MSPKKQGTFDEHQMESIISDVMHHGSYGFQYTSLNGKCNNCVLYLPPPIGIWAIESKFLLESCFEFNNLETSNKQPCVFGIGEGPSKGARFIMYTH